jgi:hypothetical protein
MQLFQQRGRTGGADTDAAASPDQRATPVRLSRAYNYVNDLLQLHERGQRQLGGFDLA